RNEYEDNILPHMKHIVSNLKSAHPNVPVILYSQPTNHIVDLMAASGANAVSVDWRTPLSEIAKKIPANVSIQGNVDPIVMTLDWDNAKPFITRILEDAKRAEILPRLIFNVGHGVTPHTKPDTIA